MLNAVNLNLVAFDAVAARRAARRPGVHAVRHRRSRPPRSGSALAIVLLVFRTRGHIDGRRPATSSADRDDRRRRRERGDRWSALAASPSLVAVRCRGCSLLVVGAPLPAAPATGRAARSASRGAGASALALAVAGRSRSLGRRRPVAQRRRLEPAPAGCRSTLAAYARRAGRRRRGRSSRRSRWLVQVYSVGYLRDDPRYPSYAALVIAVHRARCCSSSSPATCSCCWSAGRSWASAPTS